MRSMVKFHHHSSPTVHFHLFIMHCCIYLLHIMFCCTAHYSLLIFPPGSNLMSMIFSLNSLIAITLHQPHCFQYKLHIGQVMERYSRGRLWHRSDSSLWSSDGNPACWGQCPRSLDILTGHCTFFWAGELYKSNGYRVVYRDNKNKLLCFLDVLVKINNDLKVG